MKVEGGRVKEGQVDGEGGFLDVERRMAERVE